MVLVETNFPRGGTVQKRQEAETVDYGAKQVKKKKKKTDIEKQQEIEDETKIEAISAELLSYKTIQEGMLLYGVVKHVDSISLKVSLPGRLVGTVYASCISDSYNKILKEFIQTSEKLEIFKPLDQMFLVGQIVYAKVTEVKENDLKNQIKVILSLKPCDIHSDLYHEKINKGMIFCGAIEEIQDHGYVIESGVKNLRCFLPKENCSQSENENFSVGQLLFIKIEKLTQFKNASTAVCKLIISENQHKVKDLIDPNLEYLMPSSIVNFTITKILKNGLQGTIMNGNFTGYVNEHQLKDLFALPNDYELNSTIAAKILYVMPLSKLVYLSLKINNKNDCKQDVLKRGLIIEGTVHHHGTGGVIFQLEDGSKAVLSFNSLKSNITGNFDQDNLLSKYTKNSANKIRIMDYDFVDNFYICTDNPKILNEKYFTLQDCKAGEFVTAIVNEKDKSSGALYLKLGNCNCLMEKIFQFSQTNVTAVENTKLKCRILGVNNDRNVVYLTDRQEYMKQDSNILDNIKKAKIGRVFVGTIVQCTEKFLIVKFFDGIKGILYKTGITGFMSSEIDSFYTGQTMPFRILKTQDKKLLLALVNDMLKVGDTCEATVQNYLETGLEISINDKDGRTIKGLVPVRLLTEFPDLNETKLKTFISGQPIEVACVFKNIFSLRDADYFKDNSVKTFSSLQPGDILRGSIKNIHDEVVEVLLPIHNYNKLLPIHLKMILPNLISKPNIVVEPDQLIYVKVLSKDYKTKALTVSAKLTDVWNCDFKFTGNLFAKYLDEVKQLKKSLMSQNNSIGKLKIGEVINAVISVQIEETSDWYIELENGAQGIIKQHLFSIKHKELNEMKDLKMGDKISVVILWIDYTNQFVYCSNQFSTIKKISSSSKISENLAYKSGISAKVLLNFDNFIICSLKEKQNPVVFVPRRVHYNDFESSVINNVIEGDFCKLSFVHNKYPIAVFEDTVKIWKQYKLHKRKHVENEELISKKRKLLSEAQRSFEQNKKKNEQPKEKSDVKISSEMEQHEDSGALENKKFQNEFCKLELKPDDDIHVLNFNDDIDNCASKECKSQKVISKKSKLPGVEDFWSINFDNLIQNTSVDSSSEDEKNEEKNNSKKQKRLTAKERFKVEKIEEERLRKIENTYADLNSEPESADQFDRLVLSDPNSSKNWIRYMVYHLQTTEIDKARTVGKRALKAISFREQQEIINVWIALLNLESTYGSKENFNDTLKEALLSNDQLKIYMRVIEILTTPKKVQELMDVITIVTKKFKENPDVWKSAASALFHVNMKERGQQLLHRSLSVLPEREHVNTIVAFANINHKYDDKETAHTLMEQVLTSYPKRVDVWSQYIDMLLKDGLIEAARRTLERAVVQKIPLKKMRILFKKYLEFEEKWGDETSVLKVKELAENYVKNEI